MPQIADLTKALKLFATTQADYTSQLDELWRILKVVKGTLTVSKDTQYAGTGPDVIEFVNWFHNVVQNQKGGAKTADRDTAFQILKQDLLNNLTPGAFTKIDPVKFAFQLALRIREPKIIDQTSTNLCGPNSLVIQMARDRPSQYVTMAIQLFRTGRSALDKMEIEPGDAIKGGYDPDALGECDYVVLGSVRNSSAILLGDNMVRNIGLLTKPGVLCDWLRQAGYSHIEDHTFFELPLYARPISAMTTGALHGQRPINFTDPSNNAEKLTNLQLMATKLALQHQVIMNAEALLAEGVAKSKVTNSGNTGQSNAMTTHWTLISKLTLSATHVTEIKLYTWGGSFKRNNIPINDFVSRYAGFVSYAD